jgi:hypothetical protein
MKILENLRKCFAITLYIDEWRPPGFIPSRAGVVKKG